MTNRLGVLLLSLLVLFASPVPGSAQTALVPTISGNELTARIELPGGLSADLTLSFEKVVGLNESALSLSAAVVDPSDPALVARLGSASLPAGFPVVVRIEPTASSALSFEGVYKLSLYTHNLTFAANSPLRLYRSPAGGSFGDMTGSLQAGSVRAGGSGPGFSEFVIAADTRDLDSVIAGKFDAAQVLLTAHGASMTPSVAADLQSRLNQARASYDAGALGPAIDAVNGFAAEVANKSGAAIPNVWRANGGGVNVAGLLEAAADTLKFSLVCKSNQPALP